MASCAFLFSLCLQAGVFAAGTSVAACTTSSSDDGACAAMSLDEAEGIRLLQRSAAQVHEGEMQAGESSRVDTLGTAASSLVDMYHRWGDLFSSRRRRSGPEGSCTDGAYFKYSDIKLEEGLKFKYAFENTDRTPVCASSTKYGPNECCLKFGSTIVAKATATLPAPLTAGATVSVHVSGWYGILPLRDNIECKLCGEPCNACPSISNYLPSVFPCKPAPMPPCPVAAGTMTNITTVVLPADLQGKVKGTSATVTWTSKSADGSLISGGEVYVKGPD
eukprot:TRINITY_DN76063_c0_g1_i2.p1 TRINITY_DN76063_c0_g1~~TRINITY_DN76063_c0_g1_i2.p1  ORF type:complete len:277 (-),score=46.60 TRINITY_DN76063_c0_g1_i2:9-839(-)